MKTKKISNSKFKNTGVLFELLVRQVTADTISGKPSSKALGVMKKYFNASTELGKEMQLYRAFFETGRLTETKAIHFIDLIVEQRRKLDEKKLAREKYDLIKEIKQHYDLKEFLSVKIPSYTIHASVYKTFANDAARNDQSTVVNISEVAQAKFMLVEHLVRGATKPSAKPSDALLEEFKNQTEDLRLLSYKLLVDRFNEKYANLNDKQKTLLREFINNVSNTNTLLEYVKREVPEVKRGLVEKAKREKEKVVAIKLNEVAAHLDRIGSKKSIKDNEVTALMIAYELLKEPQ